MKRLYLTSTPSHLTLSLYFALKNKNYKNYLFILDNYQNAEFFKKKILAWKRNPFEEIKIVPKMNSKFPYSIIGQIKEMKSFKNKNKFYDEIYNYNHHFLLFDWIVKTCGKKGIYVEDGFGAYYEDSFKNKSFIKKIYMFYLYKFFLKQDYNLALLGKQYKVGYFQFPKNSKFKDKIRFSKLDYQEVYHYLSKSGFFKLWVSELKKLDKLLILEHPDFFNVLSEKGKRKYNSIVKFLQKEGYTLKVHPRDIETIKNNRNSLKSFLPIEYFFAENKNSDAIVLLFKSTSSSILKKINPKLKIFSLIKEIGDFPEVEKILKRSKIPLLDRLEDIK